VRTFGAAGPLLRAEGCEALVRAEDLSVMGIAEVLPALPRIFRALSTLAAAAHERRPALALLIDSPDFNLRLAARLRPMGIPVVDFIGPTVWAWRAGRVKQIARDVTRMLVILPFEAEFYADHGVRAVYVGNPVADRHRAALPARAGGGDEATSGAEVWLRTRAARKAALGFDPARPLVALLPGSRRQEIARLWPVLLETARALGRRRGTLQLAVPVAHTIDRGALETLAREAGVTTLRFLDGQAPELLAASDAAVVASGTATLEAALALAPQVIVYKTSWLTYLVARLLVRVQHIGLVNLLAERRLAPELLQNACTPDAICAELEVLLDDPAARDLQLEGAREVQRALLPPGAPDAARRAAEEVAALLPPSS
jgi:lipid-A-disaccharide synthase